MLCLGDNIRAHSEEEETSLHGLSREAKQSSKSVGEDEEHPRKKLGNTKVEVSSPSMVEEQEISFSSLRLVSLDRACDAVWSFDVGGEICEQTPLSIVRPDFQYGEACSMEKALDFREHFDYSLGEEQWEASCLEKF